LQAKRDTVADTISQLLEGDNTAIVASPVVAPDVANDLSITDSLNDGFVSPLPLERRAAKRVKLTQHTF
jgi:hypothetical protein